MDLQTLRTSAEDLDALLDELAADGALWAPARQGAEVVFRRVGDAREICRDYVNTLVPPRDLLMPSPERLLAYSVAAGVPALDPPAGEAPAESVLFGARSCDVAGLAYVERFLSGEVFGRPDLADPGFLARRRAMTVLSVTCEEPGPTCMCVCCKGGPALASGYDWQLTRLESGWLVEVGSERGALLAGRFAGRLQPADAADLAAKEALVARVVRDFERHSTRRVQTMAAARMVSAGRLSPAFWARLGERCFECGGCAFVCPTCTCFNVADVGAPGAAAEAGPGAVAPAVPGGPVAAPADGHWERVRLRDCCTLPGFVRQAGGAYPRWTTGERCLTRFFHKLSWQFHERMEAPGCTGCGRCGVVCLGELGIARVAEAMTAELTGTAPPAARARAGAAGPKGGGA